ncbi:MAG: hypothetical protein N0C84_01220 [Candidatus Thiodiazotropha taylori]|uniref:GIY-YIG domain-containing protein n=1 Tax=Candidatus Thiodiazotropha taylori TaxID=2792791 RepID=A0A9E4N1R7_9GAMM|nr:hypothetical protein [Candidatus Thiodiazotropha taylori]MCW4255067.1 hypothetical protein [Candidatus Thiodiazotropha taylori]
MMEYYVYQYIRNDKSPYYIGKGKGNRINDPKHRVGLPSENRRIVIAKNLSNHEACLLEKKLISRYGRKDLGTGILHNQTDGGDGGSTTSGKVWINNGADEKNWPKDKDIPDGWVKGRCKGAFKNPQIQSSLSKRSNHSTEKQRNASKRLGLANGKPITINGVTYPSKRVAWESLGLTRAVFNLRLKKGLL